MFSARNIITLLIVVLIISGIAFFSLKDPNAPIITSSPTPTESSGIVAIESIPESETSEVRSPDGEMQLIMEKTTNGDNTTYSFLVLGTEENTRRTVFEKTVLAGTSFEISPNAWSPDNKYFFITEKGANSLNYLVFRRDGESFSEGEEYIDVLPRFIAKNTEYTLSEITGWDSETLLHVYTIKESRSRGPSFWFEVPSKAIIQLASR